MLIPFAFYHKSLRQHSQEPHFFLAATAWAFYLNCLRNKRHNYMKKTTVEILLPRYLLVMASLTAVMLPIGCTQQLPTIMVSPPAYTQPLQNYHLNQINLGQFTPRNSKDEQWTWHVRDYLQQKLNALIQQPPTDRDTAHGPTLELIGAVAVTYPTPNTDNNPGPTTTEITLQLKDPHKNAIIKSIMLAGKTEQSTDPAVKALLENTVDTCLHRLFPPEKTIAVTLAPGRSPSHRQGRRAAEQGDYHQALTCFQKAIDAQPNDHAALFNAALISEAQGHYHNALTFYRRAALLNDSAKYQNAYKRVQSILEHSR